MRKLFIITLAVVLIVGMGVVGMAQEGEVIVDQEGAQENIANVTQEDVTNNSLINLFQSGIYSALTAKAVINQTAGFSPNEIVVNQKNTDSYLFIDQGGHAKSIYVDQIGNRNWSTVNILGVGGYEGMIDILQEDNDNSHITISRQTNDSNIDIWQHDQVDSNIIIDNQNAQGVLYEKFNEIDINQISGANNFVRILNQQTHEFKGWGEDPEYYWDVGQTAEITQNGDNSTALLIQDDLDKAPGEDEKIGGGNEVFLTQLGNDYFNAEQYGRNNLVNLEQDEGHFVLTQQGIGNKVVGAYKDGNQLWEGYARQTDSSFVGNQTGEGNEIGLYQAGNDSANIVQNGDSNKAILSQETGANVANIDQLSDNGVVKVHQDGGENNAIVNQN